MNSNDSEREDMVVNSNTRSSLLESVVRPMISAPCGEVQRRATLEMEADLDGQIQTHREVQADGRVFTPGGVRYVSSKVLTKFTALRSKAHTVLLANGTRFLESVYMIPACRMEAVREELAQLTREFVTYKNFLGSLHVESGKTVLGYHMDLWAQEHPDVLRFTHLFPSVESILAGAKCSFGYFSVQPMVMEGIEDGIAEALHGIPMQVLSEVAQDVKASFLRHAYRRAEAGAADLSASSKAIGVLRRVQAKLAGLAMASTELRMAADYVERCINRLPSTAIKARDYDDLVGVMSIIADPMTLIAAAVHGEESADLSWNSIAGSMTGAEIDDEEAASEAASEMEAEARAQDEEDDDASEASAMGLPVNEAQYQARAGDHERAEEAGNSAEVVADASSTRVNHHVLELVDRIVATDPVQTGVVVESPFPETSGALDQFDW
jgi:hypothetical protein